MERKTGLVFFPAFDWAISPTHPEREERLLYTRDQLFEEGLWISADQQYKPRMATHKDIARAHFCVPDVATQITEAHLLPWAVLGSGRCLDEQGDHQRFCLGETAGTPCYEGGPWEQGFL